jgi:hypothetical protein
MFSSDEARLQGGLGLGGTYSWNDGKYAVHGEAMVRGTFDNNYSVGRRLQHEMVRAPGSYRRARHRLRVANGQEAGA